MTGHVYTAVAGVLVGFSIRTVIWAWFQSCPHRVAWFLSLTIAEWAKRAGFTHIHVDPSRMQSPAGTVAIPFDWLIAKLREYASDQGNP